MLSYLYRHNYPSLDLVLWMILIIPFLRMDGGVQGESNNSTVPTFKPTTNPSTFKSKRPSMRPTIHPKWVGCVGDASIPLLIERGQPTVVCMSLGPSGDWSKGANVVRYSFTPLADQYSRFTIPGCMYPSFFLIL